MTRAAGRFATELVDFTSEKIDWADSGRAGRVLAAAKRALFCAAMVSFKADLAGTAEALLDCPVTGFAELFREPGSRLGLPEYFSRRVFDFASNVDMILSNLAFAASTTR